MSFYARGVSSRAGRFPGRRGSALHPSRSRALSESSGWTGFRPAEPSPGIPSPRARGTWDRSAAGPAGGAGRSGSPGAAPVAASGRAASAGRD